MPTRLNADKDRLLQEDVTAMIADNDTDSPTLAHDIIVVVRERVLREIQSYARENIR